MASYYTLGASLPDLLIDDAKIEYTTRAFVEELRERAPKSDRKQIDLVLLRGDNRVLVSLLKEEPIPEIHMPLAVGEEVLNLLITAIRSEGTDDPFGRVKVPAGIPDYMVRFVREYINEQIGDDVLFVEDYLSTLYHKYVSGKANTFLKSWFEINLNVNNILAALTAKKYDLDYKKYLIGSNEIVRILNSGVWSDINTLDGGEMVAEIMKIGEESDPMHRERKIDAFKWRFLDELTFTDTFSINAMVAYLLKLQILERWIVLDKAMGKERFREIIMGLKKEGRDELASFVEKNKKK